MPFDRFLIRDILVQDAATAAMHGAQRLWSLDLPAGYVYYLEDAYMLVGTTVAVATGNTQSYTLVDDAGNTIGTIAAGAALGTSGTVFGSLSTQYREVDATSTRRVCYLKINLSGAGATPPPWCKVVTRFSVRRPGSAA